MYHLLSVFSDNLTSDNVLCSVDKIVLKGTLKRDTKAVSYLDSLYGYLNNLSSAFLDVPDLPFPLFYLTDIHYKTKIGEFQYRENFIFDFTYSAVPSYHISFYFGLGFSDLSGIDFRSWKLEFNPNKVGDLDVFKDFYKFLFDRSLCSVKLVEWDFALDFPVVRSDFCLVRYGKRIYQNIVASKVNRTEYLGKRHSNGYCKLYNKRIEADLDYNLTRLEITLTDLSFDNLLKVFPRLYVLPENLSLEDLSNKDFIVLWSVLKSDDQILDYLNPEAKRRWLKKLDNFCAPFVPDRGTFKACADYVASVQCGVAYE